MTSYKSVSLTIAVSTPGHDYKNGGVGLPEDIEVAKVWLLRLKQYMPALEGNSNRFRDWPGLEEALNSNFVIEDRFVRPIEAGVYNTHFRDALIGKSFNELVELFDGRICSLFGDEGPDCIIVCIKRCEPRSFSRREKGT